MAQILVFGASTAYGVGSTVGGWPDILKAQLHQDMYCPGGIGEVHEVYNLGIPFEATEDIMRRMKYELSSRNRQNNLILIFMIGGNNAKAVDEPNNFVSTPEEYAEELKTVLEEARSYTANIICVGSPPVEESRTTPKGSTYFFNERRKLFEDTFASVCQEEGVTFVPLFDEAMLLPWGDEYLYEDGLHPNDNGYEWIAARVKPVLDDLL